MCFCSTYPILAASSGVSVDVKVKNFRDVVIQVGPRARVSSMEHQWNVNSGAYRAGPSGSCRMDLARPGVRRGVQVPCRILCVARESAAFPFATSWSSVSDPCRPRCEMRCGLSAEDVVGVETPGVASREVSRTRWIYNAQL